LRELEAARWHIEPPCGKRDMPCCSTFETAAEQQFTGKRAAQELNRYRRNAIGATTRLLRDGVVRAGLNKGTLLDIGAGIGALTFELLDRGMTEAVVVEASPAYLAASRDEAIRRHQETSVRFVGGDFLNVAETLPNANVVTLDRVVCCYPWYEPLLEAALRRAGNGLALSYPKDRWYVKGVVRIENALRSRRTSFPTFVHPVAQMQQRIERAGFDLMERRSTTVAWTADVFVTRQR
jgi:SAM-dependent methyltransferase